MTKSLVSAMVLAALAGAANAQTIEFVVVERNNQHDVVQGGTAALNNDAILDFAVRARVTSTNNSFLGGFGFNVALQGEGDTNGTLRHGTISTLDGSYVNTIGAAAGLPVVGTHGLAKAYTYLAGINANFDGVINTNQGTFTNTVGNQEIGLVTGAALGLPLLQAPGIDPNQENNPATWTGYGLGNTPAEGATAPMDPAIGGTYFAMGQFVDVFRFRYTVSNFSARTFVASLEAITSQIANQFLFSNGAWGINTSTFTGATVAPWTINVTPAPASAALLGLGGLIASRRRRA